MKLKISFWIFSLLSGIILVTANHQGGTLARTVPNSTGISPIGWIIFIVIIIAVGYIVYWIFKKDKNKF